MDFQHWGEEYLEEAEVLRLRIQKLREELPLLDGGHQDALLSRINILYQMYLELRHTGRYLKRQRRHAG